jgi:putative nucleotidyltransferase with HDIG domain
VNSFADFTSASLEDILEWAETQPWAADMAACSQDAVWHAEGDVWTHTKMVARELPKLPEWESLPVRSQLQLIFTALFHDAGKPATTIVNLETGRTHAPKHAVVGMELAREVLREFGSDLTFREEVAGLVRYHGRPPHLLEKADPAKDVITTSWLTRNDLLYNFALADNRGRTSGGESARSDDTLHLWKLAAEETNCFRERYSFVNDHARFLFFRDQLSSLHYTPREDYRCTVTMMCGLQGAGKDTWLKTHKPELPSVSLDDLRQEMDVDPKDDQGAVISTARERCREFLRAKTDFAFNATNTMKQTRQRWIDLFADYSARIELVYIEPDIAKIREQNQGRRAVVPWRIIEKLLKKLEPPTLVEGHAVRWVG